MALARVARGGADMGERDDVVEFEQRRRHVGLVLVDVEPGRENRPVA